MILLILGIAVFLGAHLFTRARVARAAAIARLGEGGYKIAYSLVSVLGLVLIVLGWRAAPYVELWSPPTAMRHVAALLIWPAFVLFFAAHLPGHIRAKMKHPMLAGVKLWATAHLLANGDLASVILFGSLLAWAVAARIGLKRQERAEGATPRPANLRADLIALVVGTVVYVLFGLYLHPILIGKPVFGS